MSDQMASLAHCACPFHTGDLQHLATRFCLSEATSEELRAIQKEMPHPGDLMTEIVIIPQSASAQTPAQAGQDAAAVVSCPTVLLAFHSKRFLEKLQGSSLEAHYVSRLELEDDDTHPQTVRDLVNVITEGALSPLPSSPAKDGGKMSVDDDDDDDEDVEDPPAHSLFLQGTRAERLWCLAMDLDMPEAANAAIQLVMAKYSQNSTSRPARSEGKQKLPPPPTLPSPPSPSPSEFAASWTPPQQQQQQQHRPWTQQPPYEPAGPLYVFDNCRAVDFEPLGRRAQLLDYVTKVLQCGGPLHPATLALIDDGDGDGDGDSSSSSVADGMDIDGVESPKDRYARLWEAAMEDKDFKRFIDSAGGLKASIPGHMDDLRLKLWHHMQIDDRWDHGDIKSWYESQGLEKLEEVPPAPATVRYELRADHGERMGLKRPSIERSRAATEDDEEDEEGIEEDESEEEESEEEESEEEANEEEVSEEEETDPDHP